MLTTLYFVGSKEPSDLLPRRYSGEHAPSRILPLVSRWLGPCARKQREAASISDPTEGRAKGLSERSDGLPSQFSVVSLPSAEIPLHSSAGTKDINYLV